MVESGRGLRFSLKASERSGVVLEGLAQKLERDLPFELAILGKEDFTHAAFANRLENSVPHGQHPIVNCPCFADRILFHQVLGQTEPSARKETGHYNPQFLQGGQDVLFRIKSGGAADEYLGLLSLQQAQCERRRKSPIAVAPTLGPVSSSFPHACSRLI